VTEVELTQLTEHHEASRQATAQLRVIDLKGFQFAQLTQFCGNPPAQRIHRQDEPFQVGQIAQLRWDAAPYLVFDQIGQIA
jgi:hypothetical protein